MMMICGTLPRGFFATPSSMHRTCRPAPGAAVATADDARNWPFCRCEGKRRDFINSNVLSECNSSLCRANSQDAEGRANSRMQCSRKYIWMPRWPLAGGSAGRTMQFVDGPEHVRHGAAGCRGSSRCSCHPPSSSSAGRRGGAPAPLLLALAVPLQQAGGRQVGAERHVAHRLGIGGAPAGARPLELAALGRIRTEQQLLQLLLGVIYGGGAVVACDRPRFCLRLPPGLPETAGAT
uniref:Uncharacterized protein n=1 Tax=Macrostomum lignano TaxID=282301 RepID=A0A1I8FG33_9PLAT